MRNDWPEPRGASAEIADIARRGQHSRKVAPAVAGIVERAGVDQRPVQSSSANTNATASIRAHRAQNAAPKPRNHCLRLSARRFPPNPHQCQKRSRQIYESAYAIARPQIQAGKIKVLAVTNTARASAIPDVPTVAEAGYAALTNWVHLMLTLRALPPLLPFPFPPSRLLTPAELCTRCLVCGRSPYRRSTAAQ
jgi:Tripartite tricarboxylate transporter family receptor